MDYKQEAEKIVEIFMPIVVLQTTIRRGLGNDLDIQIVNYTMSRKPAIQCAIKHVEGLIQENELGNVPHTAERWIELNIVLTELKSRT